MGLASAMGRVRFVRQVAQIGSAQAGRGAFAMLAGVLVARALGPDGKGEISVLVALGAMAILLTTLGLHTSSIYMLGRHPSDRESIVSNNTLVGAAGGLVTAAGLLAAGLLFRDQLLPGIPLSLFALYVAAIPFAYYSQFAQRLALGLGSVRVYNVPYLIEGGGLLLGTAVCLAAFGSRIEPLISLRVLIAIAISVVLLVGLRTLVSSSPSSSFTLSGPLFRRQLRLGVRSYASALFWVFLLQMDIVLCNHYLGNGPTGVYSVAVTLGGPVVLLASVVGTLLYQRVASDLEGRTKVPNTNRVMRLMVPLSVLAAIAVGAVSLAAIPLVYGSAFESAWGALLLLLPGLVALTLETVLMNYMAGDGYPPVVYRAPLVGLAINLLANLYLIPRMGIDGAAIASSISYAVVFLLLLASYRKRTSTSVGEILRLRASDLQALAPWLGRPTRGAGAA